ncbi:hypothetical protein [Streptomyces sp. HUAS TT7]|uniref:hypothetical protein n=1 Tax=Streptomyces sp. HUAS TT7 TaxID=3447507 RepID=UPI003F65BA4C
MSTRRTAPPTASRPEPGDDVPRYRTIAAAIQRLRGPVPPPVEIARLYGVPLPTAQFALRALHTRECAASRRAAEGDTTTADPRNARAPHGN